MLESLINPKKAERRPWEMFFIGLFYALFSIIFVNWMFARDPVFGNSTSLLIITFTVMLSIPFMFYTIKFEEKKDEEIEKERILIREHGKALLAFTFLFLGFLVAFSLAYVILPQNVVSKNFELPIKQYCTINSPGNVEGCITEQLGVGITGEASGITGQATGWNRVMDIFSNNMYVLIFCLIFSLAFGAGAIFILTWNASVIASAIGSLSKASLTQFPAAFFKYMIHGLPEIGAYFVAGLAGGIISMAVIRHDVKEAKFWYILQDSIDLIILSVVVLFVATLIEVFITPLIF